MSEKTIIQLIGEIYRNYNYNVGQCVEDMLSNSRITPNDLKKDRSLKKMDWVSVSEHTDSEEIKKIVKEKINN